MPGENAESEEQVAPESSEIAVESGNEVEALFSDLHECDYRLLMHALRVRDLSSEELEAAILHVADAGFDRSMTRSGLTNDAMHYYKHVGQRKGWPSDTTLDMYIASGKWTILNATHIWTSKFDNDWRATFLAPGGAMRGEYGFPYIMVEYKIRLGRRVTVFQPRAVDVDDIAGNVKRSNLRWLRHS